MILGAGLRTRGEGDFDLDRAFLCPLGEHTEHESSEQLLMELLETDLRICLDDGGSLGEGGERGLPRGNDLL